MKTDPTPDIVLSNLEWVRALSMRLVGDAASADDLVQEAWMAARAAGGGADGDADGTTDSEGSARPWLAGVLRNLARRRHRHAAGLRAREERAARPEASMPGDDPAELLARSEQLMRVGGHVLKLQEPARSTMLMRWFEGLSIEAIAAKESVTESAVNSRLHRGRTQLKARLDAEHGGSSREWAIALIPFAKPALPGKLVAPAASLQAGLLAAFALALCAGGVWWGAAQLGGDGNAPDLGREGAMPELAAELDSLSDGAATALSSSPSERLAGLAARGTKNAASADTHSAAVQISAGPSDRLQGKVVMPDGTPVPEVGVYARPVDPVDTDGKTPPQKRRVVTDADGHFHFTELPSGEYRITIIRNHDIPIRGSDLLQTREAPHQVVVDACLLRVTAEDSSQDKVDLASVTLNGLPSDNEDSDGSVRMSYPEGATTADFFFPVGFGHIVAAKDSNGNQYYGHLPAHRATGTVNLRLVQEAPEFGHVTVTVAHPDLPDGASLELRNLYLEGRDQARMTDPVPARNGRATFEIGGLLPGQYTVEVTLQGARPVSITAWSHGVRVDAGVRQTIELEATLGGMIEIAVTGAPAPEKRSLADVYFRAVGESEWSELTLETHNEVSGSRMIMNRTVIGGDHGLSFPVPDGRYEIRFTAEGYRPTTGAVHVLDGTTQRLEVELLADEQ